MSTCATRIEQAVAGVVDPTSTRLKWCRVGGRGRDRVSSGWRTSQDKATVRSGVPIRWTVRLRREPHHAREE